MLNRTEIRIFNLVSEPKNISQLKNELKLDHSTVSLAVKSLISNGFAIKYSQGKNTFVHQSELAHSIVLSVLLKEYPRLPWSKLLNKSSLHVMSVLKNDSLNIKEISYVTGLHRNTISSVINSLSMYGVILKSNGCYYLNQKHRISDFIDYYWNYINNKKLKKLAKEGTIIWQRGPEFLFKTDTLLNTSEDGRLQPTALTMFPNYNLKIMSEFHYYFYSKQKLRVEDYILHTILISPENAIYNTYALALYSKSDVSKTELMEYARYYNLKDHVEILLKYLDYREKINEYTLPWSEHREIIDSLV